jgi:hypothetical protein
MKKEEDRMLVFLRLLQKKAAEKLQNISKEKNDKKKHSEY